MNEDTHSDTLWMIILLAVLIGGLGWMLYSSDVRTDRQLKDLQEQIDRNHCQEDDPCWDCENMGNMICGPLEERG